MLKLLCKSKTFGMPLDMIYIKNNGTITQRRIDVISINQNVFYAYCHLRLTTRRFLLQNVLALDLVREDSGTESV